MIFTFIFSHLHCRFPTGGWFAYMCMRVPRSLQSVFRPCSSLVCPPLLPSPFPPSPPVADLPNLFVAAFLADAHEHEQVNTETVTAETRGINHLEGGWPKDVDPNEVEQVLRYRKKVEKDEAFVTSFVSLGEVMEHTVKQNNAVDIYEDYYPEGDAARPLPAPEAKSVNVFRDPNEITRPVRLLVSVLACSCLLDVDVGVRRCRRARACLF